MNLVTEVLKKCNLFIHDFEFWQYCLKFPKYDSFCKISERIEFKNKNSFIQTWTNLKLKNKVCKNVWNERIKLVLNLVLLMHCITLMCTNSENCNGYRERKGRRKRARERVQEKQRRWDKKVRDWIDDEGYYRWKRERGQSGLEMW